MAQLMGVQVAAILAWRTAPDAKLHKPEHWQELDGGRIVYTEAGVALLRSLTAPEKKEGGAPESSTPTTPATTATPAAATTPITARTEMLTIIRICPNPIFVEVRTPEKKRAAVGVRNNANLNLSMRLRCQERPDGTWKCIHPGQAR